MHTLLKYSLSQEVTAFSTTRISPFSLQADEIAQMGNYAAFNVTHYCGDQPQRVQHNRAWLCEQLGIQQEQLFLPRQTHTANVKCIDAHFMALSQQKRVLALENMDALITQLPQVCIGVSTADCVPILLYDKQQKAIAAIHAGWRGTVAKIAEHAIAQMHISFGTLASSIQAIIGPSISPQAYEVGTEVAEKFVDAGFPPEIIIKQSNLNAKPHIDLWAANAWMLEQMGVVLENIYISGICTYSHADTFFSARRLGAESGRIFSGIMLH